jgi:chemotaxis family two-component system response regulator Rcp1
MSKSDETKTSVILLVEDNPADVKLTIEALEEGDSEFEIVTAENGIEALRLLYGDTPDGKKVHPDLILLDLKLPKMNGFEFLERIKNDDDLKRIPVIVLSSSKAEGDIARAYDLYANCYLVKPVDFSEFITSLKLLKEFWIDRAKIPGDLKPQKTEQD